VFAQTGVMTARSSRDGRRQSRLVRGNSKGFEVCTIDHSKGGTVGACFSHQRRDPNFPNCP